MKKGWKGGINVWMYKCMKEWRRDGKEEWRNVCMYKFIYVRRNKKRLEGRNECMNILNEISFIFMIFLVFVLVNFLLILVDLFFWFYKCIIFIFMYL